MKTLEMVLSTPVAEWPWPLRWTAGLALLLFFVPLCIVWLAIEVLNAVAESCVESKAMELLAAGVVAVIFGAGKGGR